MALVQKTNAGFIIITSASGRFAGVGADNGEDFNVKHLQRFHAL